MEIKFNPNLDYQNDAISSIVDIFKGQEQTYTNFTIYDSANTMEISMFDGTEQNELGIANQLALNMDKIHENIKNIQKRNKLKITNEINSNNLNFSIDMETGTGKTYVYLKTAFELNKKYGFKKYIILVPSVAIREGVLASLRMLKSHFEIHYEGVLSNSFQYSSERLDKLMNFARSDKIEIMVMTIQSLDSENKVLNSNSQKHLEETNGAKPIDVISGMNPIVIIDEPQTTSSTDKRKAYIRKLNPLCTLQYSATHKTNENVHKVYKLGAVDAYIKKLVKQIEVASVIPKNDKNHAYVKLIDVKSTKNTIYANLELDIRNKKTGNIERKVKRINPMEDLFDASGEREIYSNMQIDKMTSNNFKKSVEINGEDIVVGESINDFDQDLLKRIQIRKTIEEHLEKEKRLNPKGIKVISLFFIDKVANYRGWEKDEPVDGKFLSWFEEEYREAIKKYEDDTDIKSIGENVSKIHQGYFAEDNKKRFKDTRGESIDDIKAYESIMSDKEYLLSFKNPIRFIFSHSALREGWDNPNVFQICTLNENVKSNDRKRQEIGRGLRLCVNQDGERIYGFETNTLTVMANQTYEDFAKQLQTEIEEDEGFKFGSIKDISFAAIELMVDNGISYMTDRESKNLYDFCKEKGYIDLNGKTTDVLKKDLRNGSVEIPKEFKKYQSEILDYFKKVCGSLNIKDRENSIFYRQNKRLIDHNDDFLKLWNKIKDKTRYSVRYDTEELIESCANKLKELKVYGVEVEYKKGKIIQNTTGIEGKIREVDFEFYQGRNRYLPDIISFLQNSTNLTRNTIVEILKQSETLYKFYINPQRYMSDVSDIINRVLVNFMLSGIKYTKIEGQEYYLQEVFPDDELKGCLVSELVKSDRSVYEYNRYDSKIERDFSKMLQDDERVLVYTKLPTRKFVVPTPIGEYTPDWAIVMNKDGVQKLYFIVETKGTTNEDELSTKELLKTKFGRKRFEDVGGAGYIIADKHDEFIRHTSHYEDIDSKTKEL